MRNPRWGAVAALLVAMLSIGLIAAGCGDDDESSSTAATSTEESSTAADSTSGESGEVDSDGVYEACVEAVSGSAVEEQALAACEQARSAFESCATQAESLDGAARQDALMICQEAAEQVISAAEAGAGAGYSGY